MDQPPPGNWSDPAYWVGGTGLLALLTAVFKAYKDWRKDSGIQRLSVEKQAQDILVQQHGQLLKEVEELRDELADGRRELLQHIRQANRRLQDCEQRAIVFQQKLAVLSAENRMLKSRMGLTSEGSSDVQPS